MSTRPIDEIEYLRPYELSLLTQLLALHSPSPANRFAPHPTPLWLADQAAFLNRFPPTLLRSQAFSARLAQHLQHLPLNVLPSPSPSSNQPRTLNIPFTHPRALLCTAHRPLNPILIRRIFVQVNAEVTIRQQRLVRYAAEDAIFLPGDVARFVRNLHRLNSLWLEPDLFRTIYQFSPEEWRYDRFVGGCCASVSYQGPGDEREEGCEACLLARIGGDQVALIDLWISAQSRRKKRSFPPRILALVEEWLSWHGVFVSQLESNERIMGLVRQLRRVRRTVQGVRRLAAGMTAQERRRPGSDPLLGEDDHPHDPDDERDGQDDEASIIDFYRNRKSITLSAIANIRTPGERDDDDHMASNATTPTFQDPVQEHDSPVAPPPRANSFELDATPSPSSTTPRAREEWEDWNTDSVSITPSESASQIGSRPYDRPCSPAVAQESTFPRRASTTPSAYSRYSESIYPPPSVVDCPLDSGISGLRQSSPQSRTKSYIPYRKPPSSPPPPMPPLPSDLSAFATTNVVDLESMSPDSATRDTGSASGSIHFLTRDASPAPPRRRAEARAQSYMALVGNSETEPSEMDATARTAREDDVARDQLRQMHLHYQAYDPRRATASSSASASVRKVERASMQSTTLTEAPPPSQQVRQQGQPNRSTAARIAADSASASGKKKIDGGGWDFSRLS